MTPLSNEPVEGAPDAVRSLRKILGEWVVYRGIEPKHAEQDLVAMLAASIYDKTEGDHDHRCRVVEEVIVGMGLGQWEDEIEEARNDREAERNEQRQNRD